MYVKPDEIQQFIKTLRESKSFAILAVVLIAGFVFFNYFSYFRVRRLVNYSKQTLTYLYLIIVVLNVLWLFLGSSEEKNIANPIKQQSSTKEKTVPDKLRNAINVVNTRHVRNVSHLKKKIVAANQQWLCGICGKTLDETYEVDHIVPLCKGGSNDLDNLMALDPICHKKKTLHQQYIEK